MAWIKNGCQALPEFRSRTRHPWRSVRRAGYDTATRDEKKNRTCGAKNGERGIRTLDTGVNPYAGLANRCLQPLGHLSVTEARDQSIVRLESLKLPRAYESVNHSLRCFAAEAAR